MGLLLGALVTGVAEGSERPDMNTGSGSPAAVPLKPRATEPTFRVEPGMQGDVFPVLAHHASLLEPVERVWGTVEVTVVNSSGENLRDRITVSVPGWSDQEIQVAEVAAGQVEKLFFAPTFLPRLYANRELTPATAEVSVTDQSGRMVFSGTARMRIHSAEELYWGAQMEYAPLLAAWVTPHDERVEETLTRAKEFMPYRRLPGYETGKTVAAQEQESRAQAHAIYRALQELGVSYVKSSGVQAARANQDAAERIRLPNQSLRTASANCIDGVVLYAALFENLGMEPVIVIVPGHAYIGLKLAPGQGDYLYLDTAFTGRASFDVAVGAAQKGLAKHAAKDIMRVPIREAREAGIYPMPVPDLGPAAKTAGGN